MEISDCSRQPIEGLQATCSSGGKIFPKGDGNWRLQLPAGSSRHYRLAQFDDYHHLPRRQFRWHPGCGFRLKARASAQEIPGTWGFGYWNDPFSMGILGGSGRTRWPVFPETAWFFFASSPNFLSIRNDLPGRGNLAMTYEVSSFWSRLAYLGLPVIPFLVIRPVARLVRGLLIRMVKQDAYQMDIDPTAWHSYRIRWEVEEVVCEVDNQVIFKTPISPDGPLGFVLWVDNQYAAFTPEGHLGYGFLPDAQPAWIEIADLVFERA